LSTRRPDENCCACSIAALKHAIYVGRVASYQAKQHEEMQAVADALSVSANLVMACSCRARQCDWSFVMLPSAPRKPRAACESCSMRIGM